MSIIWIIEKQRVDGGLTLAQQLIGDFAVRAFASVESFGKLVRFSGRGLPDALLINVSDTGINLPRLVDLVRYHAPKVPVVLLGEATNTYPDIASDDIFLHPTRPEGLHFSIFMDFVLRTRRGAQERVVRYRDVMLDSERLRCIIAPTDEPIELPRKEAQLLRLFLERPGECLTRESICQAIWENTKVTPRTIDSHVSRLRKRLSGAEIDIRSVYGGGYVLK